MKKCSKCGEEKSLDNFSKNISKKDGYNFSCRVCQSVYFKSHYERNKKYYYEKNKERKESIRAYIQSKKTGPCVDCNNSFHFSCMDFDHIDGKKDHNVSKMVNLGSYKAIDKEISKCEVVCSNCHRIRTWKRMQNIDF